MSAARECDYCGGDVEPGTGTMFVAVDGTVTHFCSSKCEKNAALGRESRDLEWTVAGRRAGPETKAPVGTEPEPEVEDTDEVAGVDEGIDEEPAAEDVDEEEPLGDVEPSAAGDSPAEDPDAVEATTADAEATPEADAGAGDERASGAARPDLEAAEANADAEDDASSEPADEDESAEGAEDAEATEDVADEDDEE